MKFTIQFERVIEHPPKGTFTVDAESREEAIAAFEQIIQPSPGERIERGEVTHEQ